MSGLREYLRGGSRRGGALGWASAQCRPVPRELWPPVLFHGGPAGQEVLTMRAPGGDYSAIYASVGLSDPINYGQVHKDGNPIGKNGLRTGAPGEIYVIVPHKLPRDTVIRRGSEYHEWVIVSCSGKVPVHGRFGWKDVEEWLYEQRRAAVASKQHHSYFDKEKVEAWVLLEAFFRGDDGRSAPAGVRELAESMLVELPTLDPSRASSPDVYTYAIAAEKRADKYFCGVRPHPTKLTRPDRLREMACQAAKRRGYNARQLELWQDQ